MSRIPHRPAAFSKVPDKTQTVIPRELRVTNDGILLSKTTEAGDDPFAAFSEWTSEADEKTYRGL